MKTNISYSSHSLALGVSLALSVSCLGLQSTQEAAKCSEVSSLSAADRVLAQESIDCIFERGREVIPDLVRALRSESQFEGFWCGSLGLTSESVAVEWDAPFPEDRVTPAAEVALYLLEAILQDHLYFAELCRVLVDERKSLELEEVRSRIQKVAEALDRLEPDQQRAISLEEFQALMEENGLSFPERR